jgi:hypothetical protein
MTIADRLYRDIRVALFNAHAALEEKVEELKEAGQDFDAEQAENDKKTLEILTQLLIQKARR